MVRNENGVPSDDKGEMETHKSFAERDVEAVASGRVPVDPELAEVQRALSDMKKALIMQPSTHVISAHAAAFAAAVPPAAPAIATGPASPWRRRVAAAVAVAVVSAFGVAGAASANEAAPGDTLYGLDKALESVGVLDGGTGERLDEAQKLAGQDDVEGALTLVSDALEGDGQSEAATGLRNAALAVASNSSGDDVRARVSEMLQWMAGQDTRGADFGAAVSERARQISGKSSTSSNANTNASENANQNANGDANANQNANGDANANANQNANGDANANTNANTNASENANQNANENGTGTGDGACDSDGTCTNTGTGVGNAAGAGPNEGGKAPAPRKP